MSSSAKTKKDLKNEYKISFPTLRKWLLKIPGLELTATKQFFTPLELEKIYAHLGRP